HVEASVPCHPRACPATVSSGFAFISYGPPSGGALDRTGMAGASVPPSGGRRATERCSAALRRRRAGPRASLRFARTTPASRAPRERTEDQLVPMGPRDIPTPPIVRVAEGIRGVFGE